METISRILPTFLLNSLWQIPLIAAIAMLACRLMRRGPAVHQHVVWVAALIVALLLPAASVRPRAPRADLRLTPSFDVGPAGARGAFNAAAPQAAPARRSVSGWNVPVASVFAAAVFWAYLAFLVFGLVKLAWAWVKTVQIRRAASEPQPGPLVESVWTRCLAAFGLDRVELLSSSALASPATAGEWRKTIILPGALLSWTSEEALTTAIGHEMAHIARHDFAARLTYELLYLPISFHPAAWLVRREIERTREMACDELVTRKLMDAGDYARAMVGIAAAIAPAASPGYALGVFDGDVLEERIRRLVQRPAANLKRARLLLAGGLAALAICAALASGLAITALAQSPASGEISFGRLAAQNGDFVNATLHFRNAVRTDPSDVVAKLELGGVLLREIVPGQTPLDSPVLAEARQQFLDALALDPQNRFAVSTLASVALSVKQFDEAHNWAVKLTQIAPADTGGYYTIGFVDWAVAYPEVLSARIAAGMEPETPGIIPDVFARETLREAHAARLEEGLTALKKALELDPKYADAMAYINLLYRLQAAIVDSPDESAQLIAMADNWMTRALAAVRDTLGKTPAPSGASAGGTLSIGPAPGPPPPPPPPPAAVKTAGAVPASARPASAASSHSRSYWQVVSQDAAMPANTLLGLLRSKGFQAMLLMQNAAGGQGTLEVKVMAGPYSDAQALEQAKAALEKAGFKPIQVW